MTNGLKFSIITVCYNEEKNIIATIESVLKQRWENFQYLIIDGDSDDSTVDIICEYAKRDKRIEWYSEKDKGIYNAMNKGIYLSDGDLLFFLNAGDVFYKDDILQTVAREATLSSADIIIGDIVKENEVGLERISYKIGECLENDLKNGRNVCHQAIFASKESMRSGFDEQFKICADYDWLCRQINDKVKIIKIDMVFVNFDTSGLTSQGRYWKTGVNEMIRVIKKNFPEINRSYLDEKEILLLKWYNKQLLCKCMNQMLILKQKEVDISSFFSNHGIQTLAIYGISYMGQRLYDEIKDSHVKIEYFIDKRVERAKFEVPILYPEEVLGKVDAVIITAVFEYFDIKETLKKKLNCPIISMEEILFYKYN